MDFFKDKKILLTGGAGFLGVQIVKKLKERGVLEENIRIPRSKTMDLTVMKNCKEAVKDIDIVIHGAAKVGGIGYNLKFPAILFYHNAMMGIQIMEAARLANVQKHVVIGTVCAYPKFTPVPFKEEDLWNGYPEETNAPYGIAKKIQWVQSLSYRQQYNFNAIFLLPVNLYGPNDNFHLEHSHVIPALIRKMVDAKIEDAKKVTIWGTGEISREFLYVEDAAEGIVLATEKYNKVDAVNLGSGREIKIKDLVNLIVELVGFDGEVVWDKSKPDGQPRRCLDTSKAYEEFGFKSQVSFREGLNTTIKWYEENREGIIRKEARI